MGSKYVKKRDSRKELLDFDKINQVLLWATENINGVSASDIAMNAQLQIYDGITTKEIHEVLIRSAADMISEQNSNYQYVAANLLNYLIRKEIFGEINNLPSIKSIVEKNVKLGVYDKTILKKYDDQEFETLNKFIKHERDYKFTYAGIQQLVDKYLLKDRKTGRLYETPQYAYMLIAMSAFINLPKDNRLKTIKEAYNQFSLHKISLPTPIMAGVRTPNKQWSSCTLIDVDDNLDSIFNSNSAVGYYTSKRAGIGLNMGRLRAIGDTIRGGEVIHTGVIPFLRMFQSTTKSCTQNGIRGGSSTVHFPFWHREIQDILTLKNNKGTDDNRVRHMDYSIQMNRLIYKRIVKNENITLFSPNDVPDLYEEFFKSNDKFEELYIKYENNSKINKTTVKATDLINLLAQERIGTGRIYVMNVDHVNDHSSFLNPVKMSNLCVAPETKILTSFGYQTISELENETIEVWNGKEWSETKVVKTGENQKLIKVNFSNGQHIDCTEYHKFYVQKGYNRGTGVNKLIIEEKRASELKIGDKLIKYDLPFIDFDSEFEDAYTQGFFTGDGCTYEGRNHIDLYGEKHLLAKHLKENFLGEYSNVHNKQRFSVDNSYKKFIIPFEYSINSKLRWLEGLFDADGVVCRNGDNESLQLTSINHVFIKDLHLMLQSIGVDSKVTIFAEEGYKKLPDGKGGYSDYLCKKAYRIIISSSSLSILKSYGFSPKRLKLTDSEPNRNAQQFVKVISIEDNERYDDTYCVNEPKENKVVFNGVLTGNCQEITLPTTPITNINDDDDDIGEIALCVLGALNLGVIKDLSELEVTINIMVRLLDFIIEEQDYPVKAARKMLLRRSLGIGITNFAYWLAKNGVNYESKEAIDLTDELMEHIQYYGIKASIELAKEYGKCEYFDKTKYSQGILPIDTYNKNVDELTTRKHTFDWEKLREEISLYSMRNSTITAFMPCESSSLITNSTNGPEPIRDFITTKKSKQGLIRLIVPEYTKLKNKYQLAFDMSSNKGITNLYAIMTKWIDQSISANHYYDVKKFPNNEIPISVIVKDLMYAYKYGVKTLYYANTNDNKSDDFSDEMNKIKQTVIEVQSGVDEDMSCAGGACSI